MAHDLSPQDAVQRPLGNNGTDWRGLSYHGAMACKGFFCRSYRELSRAEKMFVLGAIKDWYLYGLVISDVDYVKRLLRFVEKRLDGRSVHPRFLTDPVVELVQEFCLIVSRR